MSYYLNYSIHTWLKKLGRALTLVTILVMAISTLGAGASQITPSELSRDNSSPDIANADQIRFLPVDWDGRAVRENRR